MLQCFWHLSIFESKIFEISYSGSPLISTRGGGDWVRSGMTLPCVGSSIDTWKTGWTACMLSGNCSVNECIPTCAMTSNGPRYFSVSFLDGWVVWKNCAFTKAWEPVGKLEAGARRASAEVW